VAADLENALPAPTRGRGLARLRLSRHSLAYGGSILLAGVFTYLAVRHVRFGDAWRALKTSEYLWLLPALGAFLVSVFVRAVRWRALFAHGRRPPLGAVVNATMIGYLFNNILPARAGEAARVVTLTQRAGTPPAEIIGTAVVERLYDVLSVFLVFFIASPWLPHVSWARTAGIVAGVLAVLLAGVTWVLVVHGDRPLRWALRPFARLPLMSAERVDKFAIELATGLHGLRDPRVALPAFAWSLAAWLLSALAVYFVGLTFFPHFQLDAALLVTVALGLAMIIPSPPAAVGVFEAAALLGLQAYGISQTRALPFAVVLHLINFVPFVLIGVAFLQLNARRAGVRAAAAPVPGSPEA
jgi:uncharacterized protein (TIRG00374 family)